MSANSWRYRYEYKAKRRDHLRDKRLQTQERQRLRGSVGAVSHKKQSQSENPNSTFSTGGPERGQPTTLTLLTRDGESEEGDEGSHRQSREERANRSEEPQAFEPGAPVVLDVHDVRDEGPEGQNPCRRQNRPNHVTIHPSKQKLSYKMLPQRNLPRPANTGRGKSALLWSKVNVIIIINTFVETGNAQTVT